MAIDLSPTIFVDGARIDCQRLGQAVAVGFTINWGRASLFDGHKPSTCTATIMDYKGQFGRKIGANELLGKPLVIADEGLQDHLFQGIIREAQATPMGSAWKIQLTAADPTADMRNVALPALAGRKPIKKVQAWLQHYITKANVDVSTVELAGFSEYNEVVPLPNGNAYEATSKFYESQYGAAWGYDHREKSLVGHYGAPVITYVQWHPTAHQCYGLGLRINSAAGGVHPTIDGSKVASTSAINVGIDQAPNTVQVEYLSTSGQWAVIENNGAPTHNRRIAKWQTYLWNQQDNFVVTMERIATGMGALPRCPAMRIHLGKKAPNMTAAEWLLSTCPHDTPALITRFMLHNWLWPDGNKTVPPVVQLLGGTIVYDGNHGYTVNLHTHWQEISNNVQTPARWQDWHQDGYNQFFTGQGSGSGKMFIDEAVSYQDMFNIDQSHMEVNQ